MSAKDLIQELEAACYNNKYRQNHGTWEACVTNYIANNYDELQEGGNYAGSEDATGVIEGLGIATVTIMGVVCTVQAYQGRRGLWRRFRNGITLIIEGVQYAINVVTRNQAENDVENQSSRSGSSNELDVTPIRPRIIHYPPADAPPQPLIRPTTQNLPQSPPTQPTPIQPQPIQPSPAQVDNNDHEQDNAPLTLPNTPSPTFSRTTIKPDTETAETVETAETAETAETDEDIETTHEETHDITIVPIQSKISF